MTSEAAPSVTSGVSVVRRNLLSDPHYTPYCGNENCRHRWPRTTFNGSQFVCRCGWASQFEAEFITQVKAVRNGC